MGWRFRKSKKLFPGVRLNVSKRGFGIRLGPKNAGVSFGPTGTRVGGSIPGTGLSYVKKLNSRTRSQPMAAGMISIDCPQCGQLNQHRRSSAGALLSCKNCGFEYEFSAPPPEEKQGCGSIFAGCLILVFLAVVLVGVIYWLSSMVSQSVPNRIPEPTPPPATVPEAPSAQTESNDEAEAKEAELKAQREEQEKQLAEQRSLEMASKERENRIREEQAAERRKAIEATDYRLWSSKDGKFKITADLVRINDLTVTIKRIDNDKEVDVALDKLSNDDNEYVNKLKDERP